MMQAACLLTTGAQDIHQAVYHRTHVGAALAAARPRRWNERRNNRPLLVREVAWVSQMITIVSRPVFLCPHRRLSPTNQITSFETQMIPMTPQVLRRTLTSEDFAGIQIRWCPLDEHTGGIAPARGKVYLNTDWRHVPTATLA